MQNVFMSRTTAMVAMVLGLAVSVSAQGTPFTKIASAFDRFISGYEVLVMCMVSIVAAGLYGAAGSGWRVMGNALIGVAVVLGVRSIIAWLY